jgi:hypothetical protein
MFNAHRAQQAIPADALKRVAEFQHQVSKTRLREQPARF